MIELFYLSGQLDKCISLSKEMLSGTPKLSPGQRALVLFFLARAHIVRGESTAVIPALEDGLLLLRNSEDMDLYGELQGQLLCCLVHKGEHARARKLAQRIVKNFFRYRSRSSLDKVYHALFFHSYYLEGNVPQAIKSEAFAIEHALQHRKYIRYGGRLLALSVVYAEIGRLSSVERFIKHTLELADEVGNTELSNLARIIFCLKNRKEGRHANALLELSELVVVNQRSNRNQYWATELHIEIGKNFNCQLLPERALAYLEKAKRLLKTNPIFSSSIDAVLALGWTWLLLGQPKKALKVVSVLNSETIPRERGRYFFLRAQARLALGDLELAWQDARRARQCFPEYIPYYRARACLVLSDILLAKGSLGKARRYIQEGLKIAKKEFYFPFMVKGYVLHAKWLAATGNHSKARVYCMRALQVADRVERPGLRAEIYHTLAAVEVALGRREKAVESFAAALYILKERLLHLSPRYRKSFESQFIEPIQADRDRLLLDSPSTAPRYLVNVRHFAGSLREVHHLKELGEKVLKAIGESLPDVSANIFLRQFPGGPFQLTASRGRCTKTGRHLLPKSENLQQPFLSSSVSDVDSSGLRSIGVPFCSNKQLLGLIYLEKRGETISEEEIDFLACVRSIAEIQLGGQLPSNLKRKGKLHPLILHSGSQIVGEHTRMQRLFEEIRQVAPTEATVLICGESGTGKELVARAVHDNSSRHSGPFVPVNCSALPNELVENELFGHSRGSFTGATGGKPGLFEVASGGTLFLDEIGTMPLDLQSRLLRVLEDTHIRRLGETSERRVDARVVAATNQPLKKRVRQGKFREDLYHRLNVYQLEIPPLRERPSDIALLSDHFLQGVNQREGRESRLSPQAVTLLTEYPFPGNVRELKNVVESVYYLSQGKTITAEEVSARFSSSILSVEKLAPSCAELIVEDLVAGRAEFWQAVRDPFLKRDLSRGEVRKIMSIGLSACGGTYRRLVEYFHLPANDYRKLLAFLSNHACKVDFRPFRKKTAG